MDGFWAYTSANNDVGRTPGSLGHLWVRYTILQAASKDRGAQTGQSWAQSRRCASADDPCPRTSSSALRLLERPSPRGLLIGRTRGRLPAPDAPAPSLYQPGSSTLASFRASHNSGCSLCDCSGKLSIRTTGWEQGTNRVSTARNTDSSSANGQRVSANLTTCSTSIAGRRGRSHNLVG